MSAARYLRPQKIKLLLLAVSLIAVSLMVVIFIGYRQVSRAPDLLLSAVQKSADLSIGEIDQTATHNGKKQWRLKAGSATYLEAKKQMILKDLDVTFYLADGGKAFLTARQGILKTDSNDIEVAGNVVVKNGPYRLDAQRLYYRHAQRIIFSTTPVRIAGNAAEVTADSASLDLNTNRIVLDGNVRGNFAEDMAL